MKKSEQRVVAEMARESHMIKAMVCGYHVYKEVWCAAVGEELSYMGEVENSCNLFAVTVIRSGVIIGHVPRKVSSVCLMGGTISCRVTGSRHYSEDLPQGGLKVAHSNVDKAKALLKRAFLSNDRADKENEPPKKKPKLSLPETEVNKVSSGEKLSDLSINFAQSY